MDKVECRAKRILPGVVRQGELGRAHHTAAGESFCVLTQGQNGVDI